MSREAFEKANLWAHEKEYVGPEGDEYGNFNIYLDDQTQIKYAGFQQGLKSGLAQAPVVAEYIEIGHWYQHEDTGNMGSVDEWQVEQGFFKNNPRLVDCGKVYKLKESQS